MSLGDATLFNYCERGLNPGFWAEPLNAVTNGWFLVAALAGFILVRRQPPLERSAWAYFFLSLLAAIGVGSFLFHTVPNGRTVLADVIPIGIFMLSYLFYAMRRFLRLGLGFCLAAMIGFVGLAALAMNLKCHDGAIGVLTALPAGANGVCLNGSLEYAPALLTLWSVSAWLWARHHLAARLIFAASGVFLVSVSLRSVDFTLCNTAVVCGYKTGTHFVWHTLNALTLFLLVKAAIEYGGNKAVCVMPPKLLRRTTSHLQN